MPRTPRSKHLLSFFYQLGGELDFDTMLEAVRSYGGQQLWPNRKQPPPPLGRPQQPALQRPAAYHRQPQAPLNQPAPLPQAHGQPLGWPVQLPQQQPLLQVQQHLPGPPPPQPGSQQPLSVQQLAAQQLQQQPAMQDLETVACQQRQQQQQQQHQAGQDQALPPSDQAARWQAQQALLQAAPARHGLLQQQASQPPLPEALHAPQPPLPEAMHPPQPPLPTASAGSLQLPMQLDPAAPLQQGDLLNGDPPAQPLPHVHQKPQGSPLQQEAERPHKLSQGLKGLLLGKKEQQEVGRDVQQGLKSLFGASPPATHTGAQEGQPSSSQPAQPAHHQGFQEGLKSLFKKSTPPVSPGTQEEQPPSSQPAQAPAQQGLHGGLKSLFRKSTPPPDVGLQEGEPSSLQPAQPNKLTQGFKGLMNLGKKKPPTAQQEAD